jgi:dTDP-4-dehydrorhamnose reductase
VFDGLRPSHEPYTTDDEPRPINVYGMTKLAGERAVMERNPAAQIIRTSWVFGPGKQSFLAKAPFALRRGERVTAITDTWASTTYVEDLALRVHEIVERGVAGTYHVVNEGICSYETFAREAAAIVGVPIPEKLIELTTETSMNRAAARPQWTPMRCLLSERLGLAPMRHWREALAAYVRASV